MRVTRQTTPDEFIAKTGWVIESSQQRESFHRAF